MKHTEHADEIALTMKQARAALYVAINALREEVPEQSHAAELLDVCELAGGAYFRAEKETLELSAALEAAKL